MITTIKFGKVYLRDYSRSVLVTLELRLTEKGYFACMGFAGNVMGGQCLDHLIECEELRNNPLFCKIFRLWQLYHLNNMHAGTPAQDQALKDACLSKAEYKARCDYLESVGLFDDKGYKYGHKWLKREIPAQDLAEIKQIIADAK